MPYLGISVTRGPSTLVPSTLQVFNGNLTLLQIAQSFLNGDTSDLVRAEAREKLDSENAHNLDVDALSITVTELRDIGCRVVKLCLRTQAEPPVSTAPFAPLHRVAQSLPRDGCCEASLLLAQRLSQGQLSGISRH